MRERLPGGVLAHTLLTAQRESDGLGLARARERHGRGTGAAVGRTRRAAHRENARRTGVHGYSRQTRWFPPLLTHYNDAPTSAKRPVEGLAVLSPPDRRSLRESVDNPTRARTNCGVELKKKKKKTHCDLSRFELFSSSKRQAPSRLFYYNVSTMLLET